MSLEPPEELDDEFRYHWAHANALYTVGEYEQACASLAHALRLRPVGKVVGLMALARYQLGQYDTAAELYARLVEESPTEVVLRVNLGLALMKGRRFAEAARHLTIVVEQRPDHTKAMGYLGLALLQTGEVARAREWFSQAGNKPGLALCERALTSGAQAALAATPPPEVPPPERPEEPTFPEPAASDEGSKLGRFVTARLVRAADGDGPSWEGGRLRIGVKGGWHATLAGLFGAHGALELAPTMKRCRGRDTEVPFGEGSRQLFLVSGEGALLYHGAGRHFTTLEIDADAGYFREDVVFAFERSVGFENGRVGASPGPSLEVVYLHGEGRFVLETTGEIAAVRVRPEQPLSVPLGALVGWLGELTPRTTRPGPTAGAEQPEASGPVLVELTGDGSALLDPAASGRVRSSGP